MKIQEHAGKTRKNNNMFSDKKKKFQERSRKNMNIQKHMSKAKRNVHLATTGPKIGYIQRGF